MPWIAVPLGLVTGAVMGALGGGGAILTIPVLIYVLGMPPHDATTASLVIVGVSAASTAVSHVRGGTARLLDAVVLAVVGIVGTYAGSLASAAVPAAVLVVLLASLLAVVGGLMVRQTPGGADDDPDVAIATGEAASGASGASGVVGASGNTASSGSTARRLGPIAAVGVGVGLLTGFFGVGGGFAIVPALTLVLGYSMRAAIGTSLLVIALNSATALAARLVQGASLDWPLVATFTVGAILGGLLGGRLARRASPQALRRGFAVLLFLVAAYMLGSAVVHR
ncbi:MAG: sulfite exporter TauE/SafE family protein [Candidatus Phosphoribacter baldrii]